jgi:4-hydroxybenzoate polyprenyltransferase
MLADVIRFLRLRDWLHFMLLPLIAVDLRALQFIPTLLGFLGAACALAFAYGWNSYVDSGANQHAAAPVWAKRTGFRPPFWRVVLLTLCAAVAAIACFSCLLAASCLLFALLGSYLYSGGPRLKRFPILCTLCNAWIFVPLSLVAASTNHLPPERWALVLAFAGLLLQNQLIHEETHRAEDRRDHIETTALRYGSRVTKHLAVILGVLSAAPLIISCTASVHPLLGVATGLPTLIFTVALARAGSDSFSSNAESWRRAQRWTGLMTGAVAWGTLALL